MPSVRGSTVHWHLSLRNVLAGIAILFVIYVVFLSSILHRRPLNNKPLNSGMLDDPWTQRAIKVREAFQHAYNGYEKYAWVDESIPIDELKPLSNQKANPFNGWGVTLFDSLDTMLLMSLDDEFQRALVRVERANFSTSQAPFFETTIRYLGGLLSAYALSREPILLNKADELGHLLSPVFTSPSGFPYFSVNTATGYPQGSNIGRLAEIASCQLEYSYLAKVTGKKEYYDYVNKLLATLASADLSNVGGMAPTRWDLTTGRPIDTHLSMGGEADSMHEYLLKLYLLTGRQDKRNLDMYIATTNYVFTNLLYISPTRNLLYVASSDGTMPSQRVSHNLEHLACFLPGLLALGANSLPLTYINTTIPKSANSRYDTLHQFNLRNLHMWAAEGLAQTCRLTYADMPSGLGPDSVTFPENGAIAWMDAIADWKTHGARSSPPGTGDKKPVSYRQSLKKNDYTIRDRRYLLRPETVESLYIMWCVTKDSRWREYGWEIFEAIERETKTPSGYACLQTVETSPAPQDDSMPSYFLAETLKYLYLMFAPEDLVPLHKYVFNTEAHPVPVFNWTTQEKITFGIP